MGLFPVSDQIDLADGAAATPSFRYLADLTTGWFRAAAGVQGWASAGNERVRLTNTGVQLTSGGLAVGQAPVAGQLDAFSLLSGVAAATSLAIVGHVTGGAPAQRDVVIQTGNAANPQVLVTRLTFGSNAAEAALTFANSNVVGLKLGGAVDANGQNITGLNLVTVSGTGASIQIKRTVDNDYLDISGGLDALSGRLLLAGRSEASNPGAALFYTPRADLAAAVERFVVGGAVNGGSGFIKAREAVLLDRRNTSAIYNDSAAAAPASAQIYSSAAGVFDLATGQGNNLTAVNRLSISNAVTAAATWASVYQVGVRHGLAGTATGSYTIEGATSGVVTMTVAAVAGTWTMTLPTAVGAAGQQLTDAAGNGVTSWAAAGSLREFKEILGVLNPGLALRRVLAAPVEIWRYRRGARIATGDFKTKYAGVVADRAPWAMHFGGAIFSPASAFGHTVGAIQALYQELRDARAEIAALRMQVAALQHA